MQAESWLTLHAGSQVSNGVGFILPCLQHLQKLSLSRTQIGPGEPPFLPPNGLQSLLELSLSHTKVDDSAVPQVTAPIPRVSISRDRQTSTCGRSQPHAPCHQHASRK